MAAFSLAYLESLHKEYFPDDKRTIREVLDAKCPCCFMKDVEAIKKEQSK